MATSAARKQLLEDTATLYARAARLLDPVRLGVWEALGITFPQLRILFTVRDEPACDLRTLAERLGIGASGASQQVDRLVEKGLLMRQEAPDDRRRLQLHLSDRGREAVESISQGARDYLNALLAPLDDERLRMLSSMFEEMLAATATNPPRIAFAPRPA